MLLREVRKVEELKGVADVYLAIGAGGISLITLIGIIYYVLHKVEPGLDKVKNGLKEIETNEAAQSEVMRQMVENMAAMNTALSRVMVEQQLQKEMLESCQDVIRNNTQAYIKFSETLQDLISLIRVHNDSIKDVNNGVKLISRDTARLIERVQKD